MDQTLTRRKFEVRCCMSWAAGKRLKLSLGTWNVTLLAGKEPELVCKGEQHQLDIVGLTSTHSPSSGTKLPERVWILSYSGVAQRRPAGVRIFASPLLSALVFSPVSCITAGASHRREGFDRLLFVHVHPTADQITRSSWSLWVVTSRGCHLGIPLIFWGTSMPMLAMIELPGEV